jgi:two-component system, NarL family, response regulator NreC
MSTIRLMLVDDHDIVRTGLKSFLETQEGFQVVAEANSGTAAIALAQETCPNVVLMDITMPEMDGLEATRRLKALCPEVNVLALTVHEDKQYLFEMMVAGASGYITKNAAPEELVAAIRSVSQGNVYLQPTLARWLLEDYRRLLTQVPQEVRSPEGEQVRQKDLAVLSKRELQVLEGVAQGSTNIQIGERLGISPKTVARHRERIMNKLNLHSSTELVKFAIRTGLIDVH